MEVGHVSILPESFLIFEIDQLEAEKSRCKDKQCQVTERAEWGFTVCTYTQKQRDARAQIEVCGRAL